MYATSSQEVGRVDCVLATASDVSCEVAEGFHLCSVLQVMAGSSRMCHSSAWSKGSMPVVLETVVLLIPVLTGLLFAFLNEVQQIFNFQCKDVKEKFTKIYHGDKKRITCQTQRRISWLRHFATNNFGGDMSLCSQAEKCQRNLWSAWRWGMTDGDFEHNGFYMFQSFLGMPNSFLYLSVAFCRSESRCWFPLWIPTCESIRTLLLDWVYASNCIKATDDLLPCENHHNTLHFRHIGTEMHRQTCPGSQRTTTCQWAPR